MLLQYQLSMEDALLYYQQLLSVAKETRFARFFAYVWGPALSVAILIGFKWYTSWIANSIAVLFSLFWIFLIAPRLYQNLCRTAAKRKFSGEQLLLEPITFEASEDSFQVNGVIKALESFYLLPNYLIVSFTDKTNLVIPEQAFKNETVLQEWMMCLAVAMKEKQATS